MSAARGDVAPLQAAWQYFRDAAEEARIATEATDRFRNRPEHRAAAYHALIEAHSMAYDMAVAPRTDHPAINTRAWFLNTHTLGGTAGDLFHVTAICDGRHTYRLKGRVGDMKILVMQTMNTIFGGADQHQVTAADIAAMADAEGRFDIIVSATPQEGNWIALDPASPCNLLFIRRFYDDWYGDRGEIDIELVDGPIDHGDFDTAAVAERIRRGADLLLFLVKAWNIGIYDLYMSKNGGEKNQVAVVPGTEIASDFVGSPSTIYSWGIFDVADDEALILEYDAPDAGFWSVQIQSVWTKPINFLDHQSELNHRLAAVDADGKLRVVICNDDPGIANWLATVGHTEGTIVTRAYHARSVPAKPVATLVKLADLDRHLPAGTRRVTPEERAEALRVRRRGLLQMFGDL